MGRPSRSSFTFLPCRSSLPREVEMARTFRVPLYRLKLVKDREIRFTEREIDQPVVAARLVERLIGNADREHLVAVFVNAQCEITGINIVAVGSLDHAHTTAREVFKGAIVANAHGVILGHNHPSGSLEPSPTDIRMTRKLVFLGRMLSIPVLDHVVVSQRGFRSMHEMRLLGGLAGSPPRSLHDGSPVGQPLVGREIRRVALRHGER